MIDDDPKNTMKTPLGFFVVVVIIVVLRDTPVARDGCCGRPP
jgi:hypothetical protein